MEKDKLYKSQQKIKLRVGKIETAFKATGNKLTQVLCWFTIDAERTLTKLMLSESICIKHINAVIRIIGFLFILFIFA